MKKVFGYIRVSTAKQGEGVSLIEQKDAISRYAGKFNLEIVQWFEEKETAAKLGRPLFTKMLTLLKKRKVDGVVIHKIDRSARNLKDWAELVSLGDNGTEIHVAHEGLDLQARGGRLSADIQAVIAADYIRNLRQEAIKGLYGRLKQGIYPFNAPIGYLNMGKGKAKTIDPIKGPLIRQAFKLYATKKYSLHELTAKLYQLGLRNTRGQKVNFTSISTILNNSFYIGIIEVKGMTFNGIHEPLVSPRLFKTVQSILKGKLNQRVIKHDFLFRKLLKCNGCGYSLIGEIQKGHVYYRCHTKTCSTKGVRETSIESNFLKGLSIAQLYPKEIEILNEELKELDSNWAVEQQEILKNIHLQTAQIEQRLERLTDCYIDGGLDKETFENRKAKLLIEKKEQQEAQRQVLDGENRFLKRFSKFLELAKSLTQTYEIGISEEKRELVEIVTSNLAISEKRLMISMRSPFLEFAKRSDFLFGAPNQGTHRKMNSICDATSHPLVFSDNSTPLALHKPLNREQLKSLLQLLIDKAKEFPELPSEIPNVDSS